MSLWAREPEGKGLRGENKNCQVKTGHFILQLKLTKMRFMALLGMFNNSKLRSPWNIRRLAQGKCCPSSITALSGSHPFSSSGPAGPGQRNFLFCGLLWIVLSPYICVVGSSPSSRLGWGLAQWPFFWHSSTDENWPEQNRRNVEPKTPDTKSIFYMMPRI